MNTIKFKVKSLRLENTMTYNDRDDEYEDNMIYVLNCISEYNEKYEIRLWTENGDCYSGWCAASYGYGIIKKVESFIGMTHKIKKNDLEFEIIIDRSLKEIDLPDMENEIFILDSNGGDSYYASGFAKVDMNLFEGINRNKEKRPVWIFKGNSALGKSYLAGIVANSDRMKSVYETDAHEILDKIHEDIIVIGNKYPYSVEDVKKYIEGEHEIILVDFSKID